MSIIFKPEDHSYTSVDVAESIRWTSATTFTKSFKENFDAVEKSKSVSKKRTSPWFGIPPEKIREIWTKEAKRSTDLGTWYHKKKEDWYKERDLVHTDTKSLFIFNQKENKDGSKIAPDQKLSEGIYPEHMVYLKSAGLCGQSDRVEVNNGIVDIYDYKSNKEIKTAGFINWNGESSKMLVPINHLDDCDIVSFGLQLSLYLYIILKHNPMLKPGKLIIEHVQFQVCGKDEFGYPKICLDENGEPVVEKIVPYEVKYYKKEIQEMIKYKLEKLDKQL